MPYRDENIFGRLARTGLDDAKLRSIGVITILWNSIEFGFQNLIWSIAEWPPEKGALITADLGNIDRRRIASNLIRSNIGEERLTKEIKLIIDLFDQCRAKRNELIHGVPVHDGFGRFCSRLARYDAKKERGEIAIRELNVTDEYIRIMIGDLLLCGDGISDVDRKILNLRQFNSNDSLRNSYPIASYVYDYREPPFDFEFVEARLKDLRSER